MSDAAGRIERAAFAVFATKGVDNTTMDDIAAEAGVPVEVVRAEFPTIDEILWASALRHIAAMEEAVVTAPGDAAAAAVAGALAVADVLDHEHDTLRIQMAAVRGTRRLLERHLRTREQWEELLALALAKRENAEEPGLAERVLAGVIHGAVLAALTEWLQLGEESPSIRTLVERALNALGAIPGLTDSS